jgi:hypothetical protein
VDVFEVLRRRVDFGERDDGTTYVRWVDPLFGPGWWHVVDPNIKPEDEAIRVRTKCGEPVQQIIATPRVVAAVEALVCDRCTE